MALDDDITFLSRIATFRVLGREAMRILAISAQAVDMHGGEQLFEEGEPADGGYIVVRGSVELKSIAEGRSGSTVARAGTLIGETAMIVSTMRPATATTLEHSTLLKIPRSVFLRTLEGEPGAAVSLRDMMQRRLKSTLDDLDVVMPLFVEPEREQDASRDN
jgi:CRP-like cAMP-binding protein